MTLNFGNAYILDYACMSMKTDFFRPTWLKIIIFALIFVTFVPFIEYYTVINCIIGPCPPLPGPTGSLLPFLFPGHYIVHSILYVNMVVGLILSYLISCAVVRIFPYAKIKKYKRKFSITIIIVAIEIIALYYILLFMSRGYFITGQGVQSDGVRGALFLVVIAIFIVIPMWFIKHSAKK